MMLNKWNHKEIQWIKKEKKKRKGEEKKGKEKEVDK